MAKKKALGSGLGALIPDAPASVRGVDVLVPPKRGTGKAQGDDRVHDLLSPKSMRKKTSETPAGLVPVPGMSVLEIPVDNIEANRVQPRQVFDEDSLSELAASIEEAGLLQPITVRPLKGKGKSKYELVAGERRLRATKLLGKKKIRALIRETADEDMRRDALLENLQRVNLNPLEEAAAYQQMIDEFGITQDMLAKRVSRSRPQIANTMRLLKLPADVQVKVAAGVLSAGHGRALLGLDDTSKMTHLANRIVAEGLSVRATEEIVALGDDKETQPEPVKKRRQAELTPDLVEIKNHVEELLQTRVGLSVGKSKGRLTVEFADAEDLARIVKIMEN